MGILAFIILGLIAGIIARAMVPGDEPGGLIVSGVLGILGAVLAGFAAAALFDVKPIDEFFDISTWLAAIVGAVVVVLAYRMIVGGRSHNRHGMLE